MPARTTRPPPDLRYGLLPEDLARIRAVCEQSRFLVERAREAVARSAALLEQMHPSVRVRLRPPLPADGDGLV